MQAEWPRAIEELVAFPHIEEAAILSTCNRMELYVVALSYHRVRFARYLIWYLIWFYCMYCALLGDVGKLLRGSGAMFCLLFVKHPTSSHACLSICKCQAQH